MPYKDIEKHRESSRKAQRRYYERHKADVCQKRREAYQFDANGEREARRAYYRLNKKKELAYNAEYYRRTRKEVLYHYGDRCACCGEQIYEFLTFDHIKGQVGQSNKEHGNALWMRLRREGYPQGEIQILCWNCNQAKSLYGVCPHQLRRSDVPASLSLASVTPAAL